MTDDAYSSRPRHRVRRWILIGCAFLACGAGGWALFQELSGRTTPPRFTRECTERALAELRRARGERWAAEPARRAEKAVREALFDYRRQELAFFMVRNFGPVREKLNKSAAVVKEAADAAVREKNVRREAAQKSIDRAGTVIAVTEKASDARVLGNYEQILHQRSKLALEEARILFEHEEFVRAIERADLAGLQASRVSDRASVVVARFSDPAAIGKWRRMMDDTIAWSRRTGAPAIVVSKEAHQLTLYDNGRPVRSYRIDLGSNSVRDKVYAGDNATPEGRYRITAKLVNSGYYKGLLLNYPNEEDRAQFARMRRAGELSARANIGGDIEIHGEGGRGKDWTRGCVAMQNRDMDDLYAKVGVGTPVTIIGGDGSGGTFTDVVRNHRTLSVNTRTE